MMNYQQICDEIANLEAEQRELTELAEPTAEDTKRLWKIEGQRDLLLVAKDEAHKREVANARTTAPIADGGTRQEVGLRQLAINDSIDIQFRRSAVIHSAG